MSGRGRGYGLAVGGRGRGRGSVETGAIAARLHACLPSLTRCAHAGAFGNPAHISLDDPTLLGGYYAPVPNVATAFPPDHPLWQARRWRATRQRALRSVGLTACVFWAQDVSFITARPAQTAARVVSSAAAPVQPAAPSRPAVPARDAEPWSAEEDALLVQLHSGRKGPTDASAYAAIADKTGRSVNAVKVRALARLLRRLRVLAGELEPDLGCFAAQCRWLNVLKGSR